MTEAVLGTLLIVLIVTGLAAAVLAARAVLLPSRPVRLTVNGSTTIPGTTGEKLLAILTENAIPIPAACGGKGTCGLCRVTIPEGGGPPLPTETARISPADIRAHTRLACQVVVREPLSIRLPEEYLAAETFTCTVASTRMLAPLIREIVLEPPEGAAFAPRAGAFIQVTAPAYSLDFSTLDVAPDHADTWARMGWRALSIRSVQATTRAYSLANRPEDGGRIVLNVRLAVPPPGAGPEVPPGIVSSWLFSLKPGDTAPLSGPFGDFRAEETAREMIFIGGGVGMAPLRALIHDQLTRVGTGRRMSFWYGARSAADAFYTEEFRALAARHPNFRFTVALSDPAPGDEGFETGFVHEVVRRVYLAGHPAPWDCEYYLCGPPLMIDAVRAMLDDMGVEPDTIHFDDFGSQ